MKFIQKLKIIGTDAGVSYVFKNDELIRTVKHPPKGIWPFNYLVRFIRRIIRKYTDPNPYVRGWLHLNLPQNNKQIPKGLQVSVYEIDGLSYAHSGAMQKWLSKRKILRTEPLRDKDATLYYLEAIDEEPAYFGFVKSYIS